MEIKISEAYFQRLLAGADPVDSVATLAGFWGHRLDEKTEFFGVSEPEWSVQLVLIYTGEVSNGGHSQYLLNRGKNHLKATLSALAEASLDDCAATLHAALNVVSDYSTFEGLTHSDLQKLHELDIQIWSQITKVYSLLLKYMKEREAQILVPERTSFK